VKLRPRLQMTADLVPPGLAVADIGTDHAYLPVYLVRHGVAPRAIASDIGAGPLRNAAGTIAQFGLQDQIELRLSDGFRRFAIADAKCWVLAGMGGTLMARLFEAAPWLRAPGTVIVAQPMRRAHELRSWLISNGFFIEQESACRDAGRVYLALRAVHYGVPRDYPPGYIYYGELICDKSSHAREYLSRELKLIRVRMEALRQSGQSREEFASLEEAYDDFSARYL